MMKTKISFLFIAIIILSLACSSCEDESKNSKKSQQAKEQSIDEGNLEVYVDTLLINMIEPVMDFYRQSYPKINLKVNYVNSRKAVALLFSGKAEAIVLSRNYLKDEDSLNKEYQLIRPEMEMAKDGLVFFHNGKIGLDTLNDEQIFNILTAGKNFKDYYSHLKVEPELVTTDINNSHYQNLINTAARNNKITHKVKQLASMQELIDYVSKNDNAIGVAYLSNVIKLSQLTKIRISFVNKQGIRIPPQIVHQGFIVQEKYPYIITDKVILLEDRMNKPFWFASYLSKETKVQKYFLDYGIVPAFAKIKLHEADNEIK
ncbi:MAG TPA: substrate-binding domain-containing protein [Candidatus Kapabacteria bacterium]|nr:substrate-binding domain-containing protein [Candidatus Kapabacteria bacterium]